MDGGILVVAVLPSARRLARRIAVAVFVEGLVDLAVAVVVLAVADLFGVRMDRGIFVVAIARRRIAVVVGVLGSGRHLDGRSGRSAVLAALVLLDATRRVTGRARDQRTEHERGHDDTAHR